MLHLPYFQSVIESMHICKEAGEERVEWPQNIKGQIPVPFIHHYDAILISQTLAGCCVVRWVPTVWCVKFI